MSFSSEAKKPQAGLSSGTLFSRTLFPRSPCSLLGSWHSLEGPEVSLRVFSSEIGDKSDFAKIP